MRAAVLASLFLVAPLHAQDKPVPVPFKAKGRLVCLSEELKDRYEVEVPPIHEHLVGFKRDGKLKEGKFRYYTILRTALSEALFVDKRFWGRDLRLLGRVFPGSSLLEVSRYQWWEDGKLREVYYWCEVCSIKGADPGDCACCQAKVELRTAPAESGS